MTDTERIAQLERQLAEGNATHAILRRVIDLQITEAQEEGLSEQEETELRGLLVAISGPNPGAPLLARLAAAGEIIELLKQSINLDWDAYRSASENERRGACEKVGIKFDVADALAAFEATEGK
jgi:hypothetical protein